MKISVIIVIYNPVINQLTSLVKKLLLNSVTPIIVDNSDTTVFDLNLDFDQVKYVRMNGNEGIAKAQNQGIKLSIKENFDIIGFLDQDSDFTVNFFGLLLKIISTLGEAVIVPCSINNDLKIEYPSQVLNKIGCPSNSYVFGKNIVSKVDLAISSGTFFFANIINKVGLFDEDFFIDFVDYEWCLRCHLANIPIYAVSDMVLIHKIGSKQRDYNFFKILVHSPKRTYYKVRNVFLLFRKKFPILYSIRQLLSSLFHNFVIIFSEEKPLEYSKYYFLGIIHGIIGKKGKYK
jgi:rhamnosyltransferase